MKRVFTNSPNISAVESWFAVFCTRKVWMTRLFQIKKNPCR